MTRRKLNFSQQFLTNTGERILWAEVLALHPEEAGAGRSLGQEELDQEELDQVVLVQGEDLLLVAAAADGDLEESGWRIIIS